MGAYRVHSVQESDASESVCRLLLQPHALFWHWSLLKLRFQQTASRGESAKTYFLVENGQEPNVGHSSDASFQKTHLQGASIDQLTDECVRAGFELVLQSCARVLARASDRTAEPENNKIGVSENVLNHSRPWIPALHDQASPGPSSTFPGALAQQPKWARWNVRKSDFNTAANLGNLLAPRLTFSQAQTQSVPVFLRSFRTRC